MATRISWDMRDHAPGLLDGLGPRVVGELLGEVEAIARAAPVARSFRPLQDGRVVRPSGHQRAYYLRLEAGGVVALKGTEVQAGDLDRAFDELADDRLANQRSVLEHFVVAEHKLPMALLHDEAIAEATMAFELQVAYLARYRALARVPLPLLVLRWSDDDAAAFARRLQPRLSNRAQVIAHGLMARGLGIYVYFYPTLPERLAQLPRTAGAGVDHRGFAARYDALATTRDPKQILERWLQLFVRMLGLGYLPCNLAHIGTGQCVDPNNAVLDGGFVDLDSLQPIAPLDAASFHETLVYSLASLAGIVQHLLVGTTKLAFHAGMDPLSSLPMHAVCAKLGRLIEQEQASGVVFDPRLLAVFSPADPLDSLIALCRQLLPPRVVASHV